MQAVKREPGEFLMSIRDGPTFFFEVARRGKGCYHNNNK
jgi:hypothetical protein